METKSGIKIPPVLSSQLKKDHSLNEAWDKLRPGCQKDYVERIDKAKADEAKEARAERVIQLTLDYAKRHPYKYEKQNKKAKPRKRIMALQ